MFCETKEVYIETYRNYEIYEVIQVDIITGEPLLDGTRWYRMYDPSTEDRISAQYQWWRVHESIDYRIKANPKMLERKRQEVLRRKGSHEVTLFYCAHETVCVVIVPFICRL